MKQVYKYRLVYCVRAVNKINPELDDMKELLSEDDIKFDEKIYLQADLLQKSQGHFPNFALCFEIRKNAIIHFLRTRRHFFSWTIVFLGIFASRKKA